MVENFELKSKYAFEDLVTIMALLRSPGGCPWDREQNHKTIRSNFIEETYEAIEAIDTDDAELLKEELGDVLLQVLFHARMEQEKGTFDITDVVDGICRKLIIRHPHVFGEVKAETSDEVLTNWDAIKKQTKGQKTQSEVLESVSKAFPALMRSYKVQHKAAKSGFDWPEVGGAIEKTKEELAELEQAIASGDADHCQEELGDLLFSAVNISRFITADPEEALTGACDKFIFRFSLVEKMAARSGKPLEEMTLAELDALWDEAKKAL